MLWSSAGNKSSEDEDESAPSPLEQELEDLSQQLALIEALEARNEAQLDSFVDEEDQWNSLEPEEQVMLDSKATIEARMEVLAEEMVQLWMGQKSMDG